MFVASVPGVPDGVVGVAGVVPPPPVLPQDTQANAAANRYAVIRI